MPGATPNDALWTLLWLLSYTPIFSVGRCLRHRLAHYLLKMKAWLHSRWVSPGVWTIEQHRLSNDLCTTEFHSMALSCLTQSLWSLLQLSSQAGRQSLSDLEDRGSWSISGRSWAKPQVQDETSSPHKHPASPCLLLCSSWFASVGNPSNLLLSLSIWPQSISTKCSRRSNPLLFLLYTFFKKIVFIVE